MESALKDNEGTQSFWLSAKQMKQKVNQRKIYTAQSCNTENSQNTFLQLL